MGGIKVSPCGRGLTRIPRGRTAVIRGALRGIGVNRKCEKL